MHVGSDCGRNQTCQISTWVSKYSFLAFASIEFKVIGIGPMFDILDLGFAGILTIGRDYKVCVVSRVVFVGGSRGTSPSLDLTFPPTGLSENLGEWKGGGEGKGKGKGAGDHLPYFPPPASASNTTLVVSILENDIGCRSEAITT